MNGKYRRQMVEFVDFLIWQSSQGLLFLHNRIGWNIFDFVILAATFIVPGKDSDLD